MTREEKLAYQREHYRTHKEMYRKTMAQWRKSNTKQYLKALKSWEGFIPTETPCEVCGKMTYFNKRNMYEATHFDHRHGGSEAIKGSPVKWLRDRKRTPETEKIWLSCHFGSLCYVCNRYLPTIGRGEFLRNAVKYVFNKELQ